MNSLNDVALAKIASNKSGQNRTRLAQLDTIANLRKERPNGASDFALPAAAIPPKDWQILKVRFPELVAPDPEIQNHAWSVFLRHPVSEPYRLQKRTMF